MTTRVRKSAWSLKPFVPSDAWHPDLEWYARGIAEMQTRPIVDPTSWRYQAAIHAYDRASDPLQERGESMPSAAEQRKFWNQCQHASWFFLPWHRMYLGYFEQIVQAAITRLGGPGDWALPTWNYSDTNNPDARKLPLAFTLPTMPDGRPNPLRSINGSEEQQRCSRHRESGKCASGARGAQVRGALLLAGSPGSAVRRPGSCTPGALVRRSANWRTRRMTR